MPLAGHGPTDRVLVDVSELAMHAGLAVRVAVTGDVWESIADSPDLSRPTSREEVFRAMDIVRGLARALKGRRIDGAVEFRAMVGFPHAPRIMLFSASLSMEHLDAGSAEVETIVVSMPE